MRRNLTRIRASLVRIFPLLSALALAACSGAPNASATADTASQRGGASANVPSSPLAAAPVAEASRGAAPEPDLTRTDGRASNARLLLDVVGSRDARVVAMVEGGRWLDPYPTAEQQVKNLAATRPGYTLLPSLAAGTSSEQTGLLEGSLRNACGELFTPLAKDTAALGFAVAGAEAPVRSHPLKAISLNPAQRAAVATFLQKTTKVAIRPHIDAAYSIDLDGNGKPEIVVQATHPDLATDFADYKPEYYSVLVVLPDNPGGDPVYAGYLQAIQPAGSFEVVALDAVADVDGDGRLELLVRARHAEGFQAQVFRYQNGLTEIFHSVGGEADCRGEAE